MMAAVTPLCCTCTRAHTGTRPSFVCVPIIRHLAACPACLPAPHPLPRALPLPPLQACGPPAFAPSHAIPSSLPRLHPLEPGPPPSPRPPPATHAHTPHYRYQSKITEAEEATKLLRERQREIKDTHTTGLGQIDIMNDMIRLLQLKLNLAKGGDGAAFLSMIGGAGGGGGEGAGGGNVMTFD